MARLRFANQPSFSNGTKKNLKKIWRIGKLCVTLQIGGINAKQTIKLKKYKDMKVTTFTPRIFQTTTIVVRAVKSASFGTFNKHLTYSGKLQNYYCNAATVEETRGKAPKNWWSDDYQKVGGEAHETADCYPRA